ncbi:enamine deaminase RidA (YjgF/YER057c/UK114 family) [Ochrobactrum sp. 19YEA23]|uniref:RidA family protein n=1 Tax=Ochrobactrum sp. 19YEA23 TaxID=3039854 RepID=UPI00247AB0F5|nr:enamine deaminase RidA (YjgF/YER057c/UK114 family) [Ochrobactrum sp. 19YEA23]
MSDYKEKLAACGIVWPNLTRPDLPFSPTTKVDNFLYVSGQIPEKGSDIAYIGQVGGEIDMETALESAKLCAANVIFWANEALDGDLDRVVRLAKLTVFVNAVPGFTTYSQVGNGASQLMNAVFGERGAHARSAIGVAGLPANVPVEVEAVFHIR